MLYLLLLHAVACTGFGRGDDTPPFQLNQDTQDSIKRPLNGNLKKTFLTLQGDMIFKKN